MQTKGRGRVGKKWISKNGNLFISLLFKYDPKKINFKQFAILNAFLVKNVISKITLKELRLNGQMIYYLMKRNFAEFCKK